MQFSLRSLLLIVAVLAVGITGLITRDPSWRQIVVTLTVAMFVIAMLRAIALSGKARARSAGFALVGTLYFLFTICNVLFPLGESLITNWPLKILANRESAEVQERIAKIRNNPGSQFAADAMRDINQRLENVIFVGHCMWAWLLAAAAAWFCGRIYASDAGRVNLSANQPNKIMTVDESVRPRRSD